MRKIVTAALAGAALVSAAGAALAQPTVVVHERYGHWDPTWGADPGPPHAMRAWRHRENAWYGHVHNCMVKYKTYDAHRDMYMVHKKWVRCHD